MIALDYDQLRKWATADSRSGHFDGTCPWCNTASHATSLAVLADNARLRKAIMTVLAGHIPEARGWGLDITLARVLQTALDGTA